MKKLLSTCSLTLAAFVSFVAGHSHEDVSNRDAKKASIEVIPVVGKIYMLVGEGGNIGLAVDEEYTLMIDDQYAHLSDAILMEIQNLSEAPIACLLNTHFHFDHTDGNENWSDHVGVIVAHKSVRQRLEDGSYIKAFNMTTEPAPAVALPDLVFAEQLSLFQSNGQIDLIHIPAAHTDGDVIALFREANVIHAGDLYFRGMYPFIDTSNGGDIYGYLAAMKRVLDYTNTQTKIIPGHGPLSDPDDLRKDLKALTEFVKIVAGGVEEGLDVAAITQLDGLERIDAEYGNGFLSKEKFVEIVYDGLISVL